DACLDPAAESRLVGVASIQDGGTALGAQRSPFVDEDAGLPDIRSEDGDVRPDEGAEGFDRVARAIRLGLRFGSVRSDLEAAGCAVDDGPEDVFLRRDVGV